MLHANLHLERIGDYCVTIAKLVTLTDGLEGDPAMLDAFGEMGTRAEEMLHVALTALDTFDVEPPNRSSRWTSCSTASTAAPWST